MSKGQERPEKAGMATLRYGVNGKEMRQEGKVIYLTGSSKDKFYPLKRGEQFLFFSKTHGQPLFGGTDGESIFLSPIYIVASDVFLEKGEEAFYQALKPEIVREMEKHFGVEVRRQGDLFAVSLESFTWENLNLLHALLLYHSGIDEHRFVNIKQVKKKPVLATKHRLTGKMAFVYVEFVYPPKTYPVVEGVLEAPNHKPLVLEGLHLLARSAGVIYSDES